MLRLASRVTIVSSGAAGTGVAEAGVKKKIKKHLTSRITWDIKGVLTRKTKGK